MYIDVDYILVVLEFMSTLNALLTVAASYAIHNCKAVTDVSLKGFCRVVFTYSRTHRKCSKEKVFWWAKNVLQV